MAMNPMRSFMQGNPAPTPQPMLPTMGSAIRGMFGGGQGLGQTVRDMAQAPDRSGGIGQAVRALMPQPVLKQAAPTARRIGPRMAY